MDKLAKKLNKENRIYHTEIPVIGLTGGIATGKTSVSNFLKELGFTIICADELIKNIYAQDETIKLIKSNYPQVINNNKINFTQLRELFFNNIDIQNKIETYLYSKLDKEFHKQKLPNDFVIYDAPVLFEKDLDKLVDSSICVYAPYNIQLDRLLKRDHISMDSAKRILDAQLSIEDKKKRSDYVIDNSKDPKNTKLQVKELGAKLKLLF